MFTCKIKNSRNEMLILTQNESNFQVLSIDGLNPPKAQINTTSVVGLDGVKFNSSKLESRNIVITIKLNGNVEANRLKLYSFFVTKEQCTFYYMNKRRNVYIDCHVESNEVNPFTQNEQMQISLLCPQPYFKDMEDIIIDISKEIGAFEFPFSFGAKDATHTSVRDNTTDDAIVFSTIDNERVSNVYNNSDTLTGVIITIDVTGDISDSILIRNVKTGESIQLDYNFLANDTVLINTNKGEKTIQLVRNGVTTNLFSKLRRGSVFFQLDPGDNFLGYSVDEGAHDAYVHIYFKYHTLYRGV